MGIVILAEYLYVLCHLLDKSDQTRLVIFELCDEHVKLALNYGK